MAGLAKEFYGSSAVLRVFDLERFVQFWTGVINSGIGVVFLLVDENGIQGTISGLTYQEPYSGELLAQEFFWFVHKEFRGGGIRLYKAFEKWALDKGCVEIRMAHLVDSMPDKVAQFYERLGYSQVETLYAKRYDANIR